MIGEGLRRIEVSTFGSANRLVNGEINTEIIISGSSRALVHYNPLIVSNITGRSAFNIGRNGSRIDVQLAVLKSYLKHNKAPKLVIQNLDLHSLLTTPREELVDPVYYMPYLEDEELYRTLLRINPDAWKWRYLPLYGYVVEDMRFVWTLGLRGLIGWQPPENQIMGHEARDREWTGDFEAFLAGNPKGRTVGIEPAGAQALSELITLCQSQGITVILVYSPEYHRALPLIKDREQIFSAFQEIAERYEVELWDFTDSTIGLQQEYFYNSQHLKRKGAELFSRELRLRLRSHLATSRPD